MRNSAGPVRRTAHRAAPPPEARPDGAPSPREARSMKHIVGGHKSGRY
ncbi:hypothetical protein BSLA_02r0051 [Burkholderia stabilis]|nr:hypothetical protein BSLA_02r0051 [Burkholderia stabilis]